MNEGQALSAVEQNAPAIGELSADEAERQKRHEAMLARDKELRRRRVSDEPAPISESDRKQIQRWRRHEITFRLLSLPFWYMGRFYAWAAAAFRAGAGIKPGARPRQFGFRPSTTTGDGSARRYVFSVADERSEY